MSGRVKTFMLVALLALGLIVQGPVLPASAAASGSSNGTCPIGDCSKPGMDHHLMGAACQMTCPVPAVLPTLVSLTFVSPPPAQFAVRDVALSAGLIRTPDPFPLRPTLHA